MDFDFTQETILPTVGTKLTVSTTGAIQLPSGATGQEPAATAGAIRWNTSVPQLEYYNGSAWVAVGSGGGSSAVWKQYQLNLGTTPIRDLVFTITDASILSTSNVAVVASGVVSTSGSIDDWQWDTATFGAVASAGGGSATVYCSFNPGPVSGYRSIMYQIG